MKNRWSRALLGLGWALASCGLAEPTVSAEPLGSGVVNRSCSADESKNEWLLACAWAVREDRSREVPDPSQPRDPWSILENSNKVFMADDHLADRFVDRCVALGKADPSPGEGDWPKLASFQGLSRSAGCDAGALKAWLAKCVAEAESLAPGGRRSELLERFRVEGGIYHPCDRTFLHRRCEMLKIEVTFRCLEGDWDAEEEPEDEVETVEPYIGFFFPG